jgi:cytochrome c oxidase subunit 3
MSDHDATAPAGHAAHGHPYHLVNPSPWPLLSAFSAGLLAIGTVMGMHGGGWWLSPIGGLCVLACMYVWWRDVIKEAVVEKAHTPVVKIGLRYGMSLFIASEVMFFVAFFWAYFSSGLYPAEATGFQWPPKGIHTVDPWDLPLLMTLILLLSGTTVTWAHHAILENKQADAIKALGITVLLGISFTCVQVFEYAHPHFSLHDGIYPSTFYIATGFHGAHVIIGTIFLAVCYFRTRLGHFTPKSHFGLEAAAWYWHFVDVVWLFLFFAVYLWGAGVSAE